MSISRQYFVSDIAWHALENYSKEHGEFVFDFTKPPSDKSLILNLTPLADPEKTIKNWLTQLNAKGFLKPKNSDKPTISDPELNIIARGIHTAINTEAIHQADIEKNVTLLNALELLQQLKAIFSNETLLKKWHSELGLLGGHKCKKRNITLPETLGNLVDCIDEAGNLSATSDAAIIKAYHGSLALLETFKKKKIDKPTSNDTHHYVYGEIVKALEATKNHITSSLSSDAKKSIEPPLAATLGTLFKALESKLHDVPELKGLTLDLTSRASLAQAPKVTISENKQKSFIEKKLSEIYGANPDQKIINTWNENWLAWSNDANPKKVEDFSKLIVACESLRKDVDAFQPKEPNLDGKIKRKEDCVKAITQLVSNLKSSSQISFDKKMEYAFADLEKAIIQFSMTISQDYKKKFVTEYKPKNAFSDQKLSQDQPELKIQIDAPSSVAKILPKSSPAPMSNAEYLLKEANELGGKLSSAKASLAEFQNKLNENNLFNEKLAALKTLDAKTEAHIKLAETNARNIISLLEMITTNEEPFEKVLSKFPPVIKAAIDAYDQLCGDYEIAVISFEDQFEKAKSATNKSEAKSDKAKPQEDKKQQPKNIPAEVHMSTNRLASAKSTIETLIQSKKKEWEKQIPESQKSVLPKIESVAAALIKSMNDHIGTNLDGINNLNLVIQSLNGYIIDIDKKYIELEIKPYPELEKLSESLFNFYQTGQVVKEAVRAHTNLKESEEKDKRALESKKTKVNDKLTNAISETASTIKDLLSVSYFGTDHPKIKAATAQFEATVSTLEIQKKEELIRAINSSSIFLSSSPSAWATIEKDLAKYSPDIQLMLKNYYSTTLQIVADELATPSAGLKVEKKEEKKADPVKTTPLTTPPTTEEIKASREKSVTEAIKALEQALKIPEFKEIKFDSDIQKTNKFDEHVAVIRNPYGKTKDELKQALTELKVQNPETTASSIFDNLPLNKVKNKLPDNLKSLFEDPNIIKWIPNTNPSLDEFKLQPMQANSDKPTLEAISNQLANAFYKDIAGGNGNQLKNAIFMELQRLKSEMAYPQLISRINTATGLNFKPTDLTIKDKIKLSTFDEKTMAVITNPESTLDQVKTAMTNIGLDDSKAGEILKKLREKSVLDAIKPFKNTMTTMLKGYGYDNIQFSDIQNIDKFAERIAAIKHPENHTVDELKKILGELKITSDIHNISTNIVNGIKFLPLSVDFVDRLKYELFKLEPFKQLPHQEKIAKIDAFIIQNKDLFNQYKETFNYAKPFVNVFPEAEEYNKGHQFGEFLAANKGNMLSSPKDLKFMDNRELKDVQSNKGAPNDASDLVKLVNSFNDYSAKLALEQKTPDVQYYENSIDKLTGPTIIKQLLKSPGVQKAVTKKKAAVTEIEFKNFIKELSEYKTARKNSIYVDTVILSAIGTMPDTSQFFSLLPGRPKVADVIGEARYFQFIEDNNPILLKMASFNKIFNDPAVKKALVNTWSSAKSPPHDLFALSKKLASIEAPSDLATGAEIQSIRENIIKTITDTYPSLSRKIVDSIIPKTSDELTTLLQQSAYISKLANIKEDGHQKLFDKLLSEMPDNLVDMQAANEQFKESKLTLATETKDPDTLNQVAAVNLKKQQEKIYLDLKAQADQFRLSHIVDSLYKAKVELAEIKPDDIKKPLTDAYKFLTTFESKAIDVNLNLEIRNIRDLIAPKAKNMDIMIDKQQLFADIQYQRILAEAKKEDDRGIRELTYNTIRDNREYYTNQFKDKTIEQINSIYKTLQDKDIDEKLRLDAINAIENPWLRKAIIFSGNTATASALNEKFRSNDFSTLEEKGGLYQELKNHEALLNNEFKHLDDKYILAGSTLDALITQIKDSQTQINFWYLALAKDNHADLTKNPSPETSPHNEYLRQLLINHECTISDLKLLDAQNIIRDFPYKEKDFKDFQNQVLNKLAGKTKPELNTIITEEQFNRIKMHHTIGDTPQAYLDKIRPTIMLAEQLHKSLNNRKASIQETIDHLTQSIGEAGHSELARERIALLEKTFNNFAGQIKSINKSLQDHHNRLEALYEFLSPLVKTNPKNNEIDEKRTLEAIENSNLNIDPKLLLERIKYFYPDLKDQRTQNLKLIHGSTVDPNDDFPGFKELTETIELLEKQIKAEKLEASKSPEERRVKHYIKDATDATVKEVKLKDGKVMESKNGVEKVTDKSMQDEIHEWLHGNKPEAKDAQIQAKFGAADQKDDLHNVTKDRMHLLSMPVAGGGEFKTARYIDPQSNTLTSESTIPDHLKIEQCFANYVETSKYKQYMLRDPRSMFAEYVGLMKKNHQPISKYTLAQFLEDQKRPGGGIGPDLKSGRSISNSINGLADSLMSAYTQKFTITNGPDIAAMALAEIASFLELMKAKKSVSGAPTSTKDATYTLQAAWCKEYAEAISLACAANKVTFVNSTCWDVKPQPDPKKVRTFINTYAAKDKTQKVDAVKPSVQETKEKVENITEKLRSDLTKNKSGPGF